MNEGTIRDHMMFDGEMMFEDGLLVLVSRTTSSHRSPSDARPFGDGTQVWSSRSRYVSMPDSTNSPRTAD